MAARASGVALDARAYPGQGPYRDPALLPVVMAGGDCWSRARIRIEEMDASLAWLAAIADRHPVWEPQRKTIGPLQGGQFVVALVEGWRGEVIHCLETDESGRLAHYKVQDPSLRNWMGLAIAARGNEISDFPICNKSFDLSYCGNDL
jgi:Ni,Fe-hydrogenase III large subunit